MAAKTPNLLIGDTGFVDPLRGIYTGVTAVGDDLVADGTRLQTRNNFTSEVYYFPDIDDADTWASGIPGIQACFWQTDEGATVADAVSAHLTNADGTVTFKAASGGNGKGWLLLLIDPLLSHRSGYPGR